MRLAAIVIVALSLASVAAEAQTTPADVHQAPTGRYGLETHHSQVLFSIFHQGLTHFHGRFDRLTGTLDFNAADPAKSAVSITIDTSSIDTPSPQLNQELSGPNVFDAQKFPTATFKSTSIQRTGPTTGKITGDLTIRNITKPVTLDVTFNGGSLSPMSNAYAIGFSATTTIKRTDFGITGMRWEPLVSDDVKLTIEAMFQHQKD